MYKDNPLRGVVWLPEHLTGQPLGNIKLNCNVISWRIIHEGWEALDIDDWPVDLVEFVTL